MLLYDGLFEGCQGDFVTSFPGVSSTHDFTLTTFAFGKVPKMVLALSHQWRGNYPGRIPRNGSVKWIPVHLLQCQSTEAKYLRLSLE